MDPQYTQALNQALTWIKAHYTPIGLVVSGSIVRGNPDKNSDFDLYVIHEQPFRQRVQKVFGGVPCEIFVNTVAQTRQYFESELAANRPVTAHMLATGQLYLGHDHPQLLTLVAEAQHYATLTKPLTAEQLTFRRYGIANLFEDATDTLATDQPTSLYILDKAVGQLIELVFAAYPRPLPRLKERLRSLADLDPTAGQLVQHYYQATDPAARYEAARQLVLHVAGAGQFFEWSSAPA